MQLLTTNAIKQSDLHTIAMEQIESIQLMERAAQACCNWVLNHWGYSVQMGILCGNGNNGGDGLAMARMLKQAGCKVEVFLLESSSYSADNQENQTRWIAEGGQIHPLTTQQLANQTSVDVWIDAMLGSGLSRAVEGELAEIIRLLNTQKTPVIAIDLPSGLQGESIPDAAATVLKATVTLCFHKPRLSFFFVESAQYVGHLEIIDIGLTEAPGYSSPFYFTELKEVKSFWKRKPRFAHKGTFGHALLVGAEEGKTGALILSAKSAMRSGLGKLTAYLPGVSVIPFQTAIPEAMVNVSVGEKFLSGTFNPEGFQAIGFGPGAGIKHETALILKSLIQNAPQPLVIDADGLNILAENPTWLAFLPPNTILTPHPGEMDRLVGKSGNSVERWEKARELSRKNNCIVILKGAYTAICLPNGACWFNSTGNPGMASAGMGDCLTGIITALLAQGYTPEIAAITGVFVHGMAGDIAAEKVSMTALMASDLIDALGEVWKRLE